MEITIFSIILFIRKFAALNFALKMRALYTKTAASTTHNNLKE
ncbi:hypothetical protein SAMN05444397_104180 [Flavobacterium aquidurense]|nr:hypothetical protein SAMN05444397_104180 [Flavobacterium aquidurense]